MYSDAKIANSCIDSDTVVYIHAHIFPLFYFLRVRKMYYSIIFIILFANGNASQCWVLL